MEKGHKNLGELCLHFYSQVSLRPHSTANTLKLESVNDIPWCGLCKGDHAELHSANLHPKKKTPKLMIKCTFRNFELNYNIVQEHHF